MFWEYKKVKEHKILVIAQKSQFFDEIKIISKFVFPDTSGMDLIAS